MTGRRLVCRLRGHDDAVEVAGFVAGIGAAVLACARCSRRKAVPYRASALPSRPEPAALQEVGLVGLIDLAALDLLQWQAELGAHLARQLERGDLS